MRSLASPAITEGAFGRIATEHRNSLGVFDAIAVGRFAEDRLRRINETFAKVDADPTMPAPAKALAKVNFAERHLKEIREKGSAAWEAIERANADLSHQVKSTLAVPPGVDAAELRSGLFRLSADERSKVLDAALAAGPGDSLQRAVFGAAVSAPSFLTGLSETQQGVYRERWTRAHLPEVIEKREALAEAALRLESLRNALEAQVAAIREAAGPVVERAGAARAALEADD